MTMTRPQRPNPTYPSRPTVGPKRSTVLMLVGVALFLIGVVLVGMLSMGGRGRDVRETRQFGNLECVYNVTQDKVEACTR